MTMNQIIAENIEPENLKDLTSLIDYRIRNCYENWGHLKPIWYTPDPYKPKQYVEGFCAHCQKGGLRREYTSEELDLIKNTPEFYNNKHTDVV